MRPAAALLLVACLASSVLAASTPPDTLTARVDELITARYFHGMPYELARDLGPEAIPILRSRLHDPNYKGFQPDICSAICMIGAPEGYPILRAFIWNRGVTANPKQAGPRACTAPMVAQSGMGLIAKNSDDALEYLKQCTVPAYWDSLPWYCTDSENTQGQMIEVSIETLAITERAEARAHLVKLGDTGASEAIRSMARRNVTRFDEIKKLGYAEYRKLQRQKGTGG